MCMFGKHLHALSIVFHILFERIVAPYTDNQFIQLLLKPFPYQCLLLNANELNEHHSLAKCDPPSFSSFYKTLSCLLF
jgi:hypothetical protein